ncbi:MAG TPA: response regulator, partial [Chitinophagaceae bacterium]|nr:response regulator [Chitinophagaceae bacterium]
ESFAQAHTTSDRKYGGTGLGLTISKNLVELFGGKLSAESQPGAGSLFIFTIPFVAGTEEQLQQYYLQRDGYSADDLFGLKILLAEDNPDNQIVAVDTLQKILDDAEIDVVSNGIELLEKLSSNNNVAAAYDIILMDMQMPLMGGFEATKKIRSQFPAPVKNIPVIALTASVIRSDLQKCLDAGMDGYVPKPFTREHLIKEIGRVLHRNTTNEKSSKRQSFNTFATADNNGAIDFSLAEKTSAGSKEKFKKYLQQFTVMMPEKLLQLKQAIDANNRDEIFQSAHRIKPQLAFFGLKNEEHIADLLEIKAKEISADEAVALFYKLETHCKEAIGKIENVVKTMEV